MAEMDTPGSILRERREAKRLTLEEVAKETNIRPQYLRALEEGDFSAFPGEVYYKGFLRSYANFLGLDAKEVVSQFEEDGLIEGPLEFIKPKVDVFTLLEKRKIGLFIQMRIWIISAIEWLARAARSRLLYLILIILLSLFLLWWFLSFEGEEASLVNQPEGVGLVETVVPLERGGLLLEIEAIDEAWLRIAKDKEQAREVSLKPGERLSLEAEERVLLKTGNAGGLLLKLNGQKLPPLGERGEVVIRTITAKGVEQTDEFSQ